MLVWVFIFIYFINLYDFVFIFCGWKRLLCGTSVLNAVLYKTEKKWDSSCQTSQVLAWERWKISMWGFLCFKLISLLLILFVYLLVCKEIYLATVLSLWTAWLGFWTFHPEKCGTPRRPPRPNRWSLEVYSWQWSVTGCTYRQLCHTRWWGRTQWLDVKRGVSIFEQLLMLWVTLCMLLSPVYNIFMYLLYTLICVFVL